MSPAKTELKNGQTRKEWQLYGKILDNTEDYMPQDGKTVYTGAGRLAAEEIV